MIRRTNVVMPSPLLRLVPWLVAGILLEDTLAFDCPVWWLAVALLAAWLLRRSPVGQSIAIECCVLLLGMLLTSRHRSSLTFADGDDWQWVEAVVTSEPVEKPKTVAADVLLPQNGRHVKAYLAKDEQSQSLSPGDGLYMLTRIEPTDTLRLGAFHYGRYLLVHGFTGRCYVGHGNWQPTKVGWGRLPAFERMRIRALQWRHRLLAQYRQLTRDDDSEAYALLAAMALGDKSVLKRDLREVYAVTGAAHVLALSGLHLGILFSLLSMLFFFGQRFMAMRLITVVLFWTFALLTGLSVSVVRSALMLSLATIFTVRGYVPIVNVLCFAAIVILLLNPYALFDVGFQLSFLSVFSILMVMPVLNSFRPRSVVFSRPMAKMLWGLLAVSVAAQMGTAPLVAFHFGRLPVYFILTNLLVIPCAYAILWLSLCYLIVPLPIVGKTVLVVVRMMNGSLTAMAEWPLASIGGLHPTVLQTVLVYAAIVALFLAVAKVRRVSFSL